MSELRWGLYETLIDQTLEKGLQDLADGLQAQRGEVNVAEAADRFALHVGRLFRKTLTGAGDERRRELGLHLTRRIIAMLQEIPHSVIDEGDRLSDDGGILHAILSKGPDGRAEQLPPPATPLLDTTLLTNAPGEPRVGYQVRSEIPSSDRIDVLMAFVRKTGIRPLEETLRLHADQGRTLRLLTTTYTGSTELAALQMLQDLGADIRVSYDNSGTRLHAKAWLFHRHSGYSTAYIGSSNLTYSAQVTGLEWNVRVSGARNPDVIDKFSAVFESHWQSDDFRPFDADEFRELTRSMQDTPRTWISPVEIDPRPFQARMLEQIHLARMQGRHRNLLVSATGTGKTVMAALDYQRLRNVLPRSRLLFVAHRREILEQSLATFRQALRDASFGELWVGNHRPERFRHVFASIQSLTASGLEDLNRDYFDVVIVDEFHHAAASTYDALLSHVEPRELLGMTATPERADGRSVLSWFDGRIAAQLRIWDAIEQQQLCPFAYYGIHDGKDLSRVSWRRGTGYDVRELDSLVTGDDVLARLIIEQTAQHVDDISTMRALGFCVSVAHAQFMAMHFNSVGIMAAAVSGKTSQSERAEALRQLERGHLSVLFSVDLFNEGVDLPSVDTLLLLRPTDSATIFMQQLGRGLRKQQPKSVCTVLDFVSLHRKEFRFQNRLGALLGGSRKYLMKQVKQGFPWLPSGCHMHLDPVASDVVLDSLRDSLPSTWLAKVRELERHVVDGGEARLGVFLDASGLVLEDVYANQRSWSDLMQAAGISCRAEGPLEIGLRRALGRMLHVDDGERIDFYRRLVATGHAPDVGALSARETRLLNMLVVMLLPDSHFPPGGSLAAATALVWQHPQVLQELGEMLDVLAGRMQHVSVALDVGGDIPLMVHARYTRREILAALATGTEGAIPAWREGVRRFPDRNTDVAVVTLDKSGRQFSPTTRYRDYAISRRLMHWESQSTTRDTSPTGQRYQQHRGDSSRFLLFARMTPHQRDFWFLGPAVYVSHEGSRPMAITWRLQHELPGDLFAEFAAAV